MFYNRSNTIKMNWNIIANKNDVDQLIKLSNEIPCLIFKHSTRCSISTMAKNRLERYWEEDILIRPYYLDLLKFREISNEIAAFFNIEHQSPQVLLIENGECTYTSTHNEIDYEKIKEQLNEH